ncbi:hypothetical protein CKM354_000400400 [Cercospora kikuchii]|uniref:Uncharacterized protein n=1 Tax=Cercospora kikuchii TaxID=84275 RepID=A0A9P3CJ06_9PEZI|nr:uncharacterized protein CKM354_000400400 [Cercospora kikuchii]GIZ40675.1 hypothetical protein CKM354_000400400 [Cercospora kikuchii]
MDWTGGTRRRYASNAKKNQVLQKQKAHFAKVRANGAAYSPNAMPDFIRQAMSAKDNAEYQRREEGVGESRRRSVSAGSQQSAADWCSNTSNQHSTSNGTRLRKRKGLHDGIIPKDSERLVGALAADMTDEARRLRTSRHHLLAQRDWLGLAAARPLKIKFPRDRDNERVGKRRKVKRSRHHVQATHHKPVTPPFQHQQHFFEPMMSGAIQNHDMHIKIGTDAFASQTQRSRKSRTPVNTSLCHLSTEFGPLSEEPMLMDEEDASFLNEMQIFGFGSPGTITAVDEQRAYSPAEWGQSEGVAAATSTQWPPSMQISAEQSPRIARQIAPVVPHMTFNDTDWKERWEEAQRLVVEDQRRMALEGMPSTPRHQVPSVGTPSHHFEDGGAEDVRSQSAEKDWSPKSIYAEPDTPTRTSTAAVESATFHLSQPALSLEPHQYWVGGSKPVAGPSEAARKMSHRRQEPQQTLFECDNLVNTNANAAPAPQMPHSVIDTNNVTTRASGQSNELDDAFWRQAITGTRASDSASSTSNSNANVGLLLNADASIRYNQLSRVASDHLRSDRVTAGGSTVAAHALTACPDSTSSPDFAGRTSMIAHANTVRPDDVTVDCNLSSEQGVKCNNNIHASPRLVKPPRFKKTRRSQPRVNLEPKRLTKSTKVPTRAQKNSVYELPSTFG